MGMGNLQRMAQQMQQEMERIQAELAEAEVEGSAGGGVVRAVVTGKQSLVSITIDPSAVDADDVEMLQDLVDRGGQRGARCLAPARGAEDGRACSRSVAWAGCSAADPATPEPDRGHPAHRARREADRGVQPPARASARRPPSD